MYYPKSQIQTNIYTDGTELTYADGPQKGTAYRGYYYKLSNGEMWTGKTPEEPPNDRLELPPVTLDEKFSGETLTVDLWYNSQERIDDGWDGPVPGDNNIYNGGNEFQQTDVMSDYLSIREGYDPTLTTPNYPQLPQVSVTKPTEDDYKKGNFKRYFCVKTNENIYKEISKETYDKILNRDPSIIWSYWEPFIMDWVLIGKIGEVYSTNRNLTELYQIRNNRVGFDRYLKFVYSNYFRYDGELEDRYYPQSEELVPTALPPAYGYPQNTLQNCGNCVFNKQNHCQKWKNSRIKTDYWCVSWSNVRPEEKASSQNRVPDFAPSKEGIIRGIQARQAKNTSNPSYGNNSSMEAPESPTPSRGQSRSPGRTY